MRFLSNLTHADLAGKKCLVRTNLDIIHPHKNSPRIVKALPTIQFLLDRGVHPIIISHRGKPENQSNRSDQSIRKLENQKKRYSLQPAITIIKNNLSSIYGSLISLDWLENLRFDPREEKNDSAFAEELAEKADIYINDDFAASHRIAASLVAITQFLPSYAGLLLEEEIKYLSAVRDSPRHPLVIIIGGIKIEDKMSVIHRLRTVADSFLLGSAYGAVREALPHTAGILLPKDGKEKNGIPADIGIQTIKEYKKIIARAKTIIWSGPLGNIENPPYDRGTEAIVEAIINSKAFSVVGGGDTTEFLARRGLLKKFSFVSTGGGAMLTFLAGKPLPAFKALDKCLLL